MQTAGIIAEYNPFHMGHKYHMDKAREITGADYLIAVISGDFVQRGAPAIFDKYERTRMALLCGADLVLEIPSIFATGSAEDFASCGVSLLDGLGVTDFLVFGSELGETAPLLKAGSLLLREPEEFSISLKNFLRQGLSYPLARQKALLDSMGDSFPSFSDELSSPNNILGVEYCKAILKRKSNMKPVAILRQGDYHSPRLADQEGGCPDGKTDGDKDGETEAARIYSSASAVRSVLKEAGGNCLLPSLAAHIPSKLHDFYKEAKPLFSDDFSSLLNYALLRHYENGRPFTDFEGFSPELASRLEKRVYSGASWSGRVGELKTKNYTYTRVSRALAHMLLGITAKDCQSMRLAGYAPYARILGFKKAASPLLSAIKRNASIPLVTKTADSRNYVGPEIFPFLERDFFSSHVYQSVLSSRYGCKAENEFSRQLIILP